MDRLIFTPSQNAERSTRPSLSQSGAERLTSTPRALAIRLKCRACIPFGFAQGRLCTRNVLNVHHAPFARSGSVLSNLAQGASPRLLAPWRSDAFRLSVAQTPRSRARPFGDLTRSGSESPRVRRVAHLSHQGAPRPLAGRRLPHPSRIPCTPFVPTVLRRDAMSWTLPRPSSRPKPATPSSRRSSAGTPLDRPNAATDCTSSG
jgi:hypothetical protein